MARWPTSKPIYNHLHVSFFRRRPSETNECYSHAFVTREKHRKGNYRIEIDAGTKRNRETTTRSSRSTKKGRVSANDDFTNCIPNTRDLRTHTVRVYQYAYFGSMVTLLKWPYFRKQPTNRSERAYGMRKIPTKGLFPRILFWFLTNWYEYDE